MTYGVGDIVKRNTNRKMEYFIIVDVFLQFEKTTEFSFKIDASETKYTGIQIYPVELEGQVLRFTNDMVESVARIDEAQHAKIMEIINIERVRRGIKWEADYMKTIKQKIDSGLALEWTGGQKKVEVKPKKKRGRPKKLKDKDDVIEYHKLPTIDDCLDALNDLSDLHKAFGDEAYLQLKEVVTKRLKELC
ncbi:hypothetical protein NXG04_07215 [Klebsiella pneumoniae]|nr:hypothetical protein [Klebsiella pneumoniae]MDS7714341.1 hypothetical protein [Klebsiella pneumoniae]